MVEAHQAPTAGPLPVDDKEAELAIKYVLDKGENSFEGPGGSPSYGRFSPSKKNTAKLPVCFLKLKMQQNLRKQQTKVDNLKNHFRASQAVYHRDRHRNINRNSVTRGERRNNGNVLNNHL